MKKTLFILLYIVTVAIVCLGCSYKDPDSTSPKSNFVSTDQQTESAKAVVTHEENIIQSTGYEIEPGETNDATESLSESITVSEVSSIPTSVQEQDYLDVVGDVEIVVTGNVSFGGN